MTPMALKPKASNFRGLTEIGVNMGRNWQRQSQ
jgi:hypothetical protein